MLRRKRNGYSGLGDRTEVKIVRTVTRLPWSGPVTGVRFELMLFDVCLEFSRTFNHAVDYCFAIKLG
jgi:hypothetical protein